MVESLPSGPPGCSLTKCVISQTFEWTAIQQSEAVLCCPRTSKDTLFVSIGMSITAAEEDSIVQAIKNKISCRPRN
jgi:hypothetical protein